MPEKKKGFVFEKSISELESLVQQMESGDLSLEESLKLFEKGVKLTRTCQSALETAEQKVQLLLEKEGSTETVPFSTEGE
ncbi:Exodeoxyribonuclease 7 small subunit [invertebrate metagenome]|uniref:Exodeoxyribonuclease 7 small subunit n=1 Tax=invertebrate metagenome TaxID=1711999 RepID=A0A2H9T584_9ZZZZ